MGRTPVCQVVSRDIEGMNRRMENIHNRTEVFRRNSRRDAGRGKFGYVISEYRSARDRRSACGMREQGKSGSYEYITQCKG